jgi:hypothetical protein
LSPQGQAAAAVAVPKRAATASAPIRFRFMKDSFA